MPPLDNTTANSTPMFGGDKDILPILQTQEKELKSKIPSVLGSKIASPTKDFSNFLSTGDTTFKDKATKSLGILQEAVNKGATQFLFGKEYPTISDGAREYVKREKALLGKAVDKTKKDFQNFGKVSLFTGEPVTPEEHKKEIFDMALNFSPMGMVAETKPVIKAGTKIFEQSVKELPKVGSTLKLIENGDKYMIDRIDDTIAEIRNIYNGRTKIILGKEFDKLFRNVPKTPLPSSAQETPTIFQGFKDLSTKVLEDLKGRSTVSKQYIQDATNRPEFKDSERNVIRQVLDTMPDKTLNVQDFADRVKAELLTLTSKDSQGLGAPTGKYVKPAPRYESITLPSDIRGNVGTYGERIYQSPIATSAGSVHFGIDKANPNYFGHTRVEDMADNSTRRVIEVQSDLYQKGGVDREGVTGDPFWHSPTELQGKIIRKEAQLGDMKNAYNSKDLAPDIADLTKEIESMMSQAISEGTANMTKRNSDIAKLQQYNDPTVHFRMIREEIKKAAQDGKSKLQFPTGDTAMKIEGLGDNTQWYHNPSGKSAMSGGGFEKLKPEDLRVGQVVDQGGDGTGNTDWIITDVLGDGKFKAVPKSYYDAFKDGSPHVSQEVYDTHTEQFDISGKVDTNNPIYKFYEKEVGKYLKKFDAKLVTDKQGVNWWEVPVTKEHATQPVQAFGKAKVGAILGGAAATGAAASMFNSGSKVSYEKPKEPQISPETLNKFKEGIGHAETSILKGDHYSYIHPNKNGTKDYGRYGINDSFFKSPGLMKRYAGRTVTPQEVLKSPKLQDTIVMNFGDYWMKQGNPPEEVARMWTAGASSTNDRPQYKKNFNSIFNQ